MRITKKMEKAISDLKPIVDQYGYWSEEVYRYNNKILPDFTPNQYDIIQSISKQINNV